MPKTRTLQVFANPYLCLDHEGRLAGCAQMDPAHAGGQFQFIGAGLHADTKILETFDEGDARGTHTQDTVFAFSSDASTIPGSVYHRDQIRNGELFLAVDGAPPWLALAAARNAAIANHVAHYGEPPETKFWSNQFPIDEQVKVIADRLRAKAEVEGKGAAVKAKSDAETAAKAAESDAKARQEALDKSHASVLAALDPAPAKESSKAAAKASATTSNAPPAPGAQ